MTRKRKLRVFPIFCVVCVIAIVFFAVYLLKDLLSDAETNNSKEIEKTPSVSTSTPNEAITENKEPPAEFPEEDTTIFVDGAPKPIFTHAELIEKYPSSVLTKTEDGGKDYLKDIVFIGDSTTHGMIFYEVLDGGKETKQVWTPKSGTLSMWNLLSENIVYPEDDSEMLIGDAIAVNRPKIVVLTLGVNGVSMLSEEEFVGYYQDLIDEIKERSYDTKIILQSIYPVCDDYQYVNSISMEKINRANSWIAALADKNGVFYLNTITALVNDKGYLNKDYSNGDGIHLSKEGFNVILNYIRTHKIK
ncbi:MAG: hypothetical protein E7613_00985 [Ruminococcaceae bacterium]|nr:hypothetical protein [Oscillospiraceae bacterium]